MSGTGFNDRIHAGIAVYGAGLIDKYSAPPLSLVVHAGSATLKGDRRRLDVIGQTKMLVQSCPWYARSVRGRAQAFAQPARVPTDRIELNPCDVAGVWEHGLVSGVAGSISDVVGMLCRDFRMWSSRGFFGAIGVFNDFGTDV